MKFIALFDNFEQKLLVSPLTYGCYGGGAEVKSSFKAPDVLIVALVNMELI